MRIYPFETRHAGECGSSGEARCYPLGTLHAFTWDTGAHDEAVVVYVRKRDGRPRKAWVLVGNL
jgi:hypothetical protein